jgi:hypothetical protein
MCVAGCGRIDFDPRVDARSVDAPRRCPMDAALIACWQFDGDALDRSPLQLATQASGLAFAPGRYDRAGVFDANTRVTVADAAALEPPTVTVELWVSLEANPTALTYLFDNDVAFYLGVFADRKLSALVVTTSGAFVSANGIRPIGAGWHHIAMRYDATTGMALFLDGAFESSSPPDGALPAGSSPDGSRIGGDAGPETSPRFVGALDEIHIWNRELSDAELCAAADAC